MGGKREVIRNASEFESTPLQLQLAHSDKKKRTNRRQESACADVEAWGAEIVYMCCKHAVGDKNRKQKGDRESKQRLRIDGCPERTESQL